MKDRKEIRVVIEHRRINALEELDAARLALSRINPDFNSAKQRATLAQDYCAKAQELKVLLSLIRIDDVVEQ